MLYGYCRSGNLNSKSLENQIEWVKSNGVEEENIYKDTGSANDTNRVELNKLFDIVQEGDTIFCKDINRLTRSHKGLEKIIEFAKTKRVKFVLANSIIDGLKIIDGIEGVDIGVEAISAMISTLKEYEESIENK
ncbi:recombinase family protein [Clostridium botulinum]|uniref:Resolvase domain protein n=1 Tax=Clostridium botulinum (strain Langeland / NCTC 10281 / Type F) TaxID=441772 RepID=A7GFR9_CLOBL|nr:recombinase family protein [Clostridium botulinum]ABS41649.1 resolvase domain protein [Clostridium botulinum F str. Langeland]ADG00040.1 resolvase domain protein [Clostridium botulinum F str. 230613]KKM42407.1 resolvase [Clostridium botulinum]MBY6793109.1 recombinase family protein [Clostridium botulinum]MBY6937319.1 recombinase family protein [Clostridium botulinum]